jgi:hypothetical protein
MRSDAEAEVRLKRTANALFYHAPGRLCKL